MFKSARWRSDKTKIKAVFKLQFHATQLAAVGGDSLTIAVIPNDVGKPTARLEKTKVKDGSCHWEKPHFETVKFTQDQKTGKINEKLYRFVVATGSSVFGIVGEVSLDFSKYSEATKLSSLSLPLKYARSTSVLHISIQRVQDQREVNESDIVNEDNNGLTTVHSSNGDIERSLQNDSVEDHGVLTDNNVRDHAASSVSDITLSGSDSSSGLDTPRQPEPTDTKPAHEASKPPIYEGHHKSSQWDWLDGSVHELSTDDSSMLSPREETLSREISDEGSGSPDDVIKKLKGELVNLARQAEVSEMEIQTLRKQIVKESKRSQDLSKEVVALKEERNELKEECEKMKVKVKVKVKSSLSTEGGDPWALVDELRQELNYEKDLNSNLRLQLQKTQESNAELILAVRDLDEMLESKSKCATAPKLQEVNAKSDTDDEDQKALEDIVREHSGMKDAYIQEQKIIDLYNEIELYKRDKDELEMQMEQIALDYEILKQENHDLSYKLEQSQIQEQLKMQYECSTSYADVNELIENLSHELTHQKTSYNAMIEDLDGEINDRETEIRLVKVDLESLENELRDLKNAKNDKDNEVERLQSEIERLKSRCNDMKQFCKENESEKENLKKQVSQLKGDLKKKDEAISSIEKRLKEGSKPPPRNNKTVPVSRSPKEVNNMKEKVKQLEGQINLKEIALERAEASFLEKEKDLKHRIEDLERRLEVLDQNIENPQASTAQNRNDAEIKKTGDQEIFELLNKNKCMEVELKEMQERYSEISLKFAEVEGERQQLVMTLRNLKNSKLMVQT
ncbi:putative NT-type C2 domain-containing protein [Helianthus annuus]|nr:putative NT-type C2 domain-containing protein [Helianthus annuus]